MGWNGSGDAGQAAKQASAQRKAPSAKRGVFAGLAVVVIAGLATWLMMGREGEKPTRPDTVEKIEKPASKAIEEVKPTAAPVRVAAKAATNDNPYADYKRVLKDGRIERKNKKGQIYVDPPKHTARAKARYAIFSHRSENQIAALITAEPGTTMMFGTVRYDEKFKEDFLKSCEEPIIASADDDEYAKELKKTMTEVKIELRDRMRKGEDICQIMTESRQELQKLGVLKNKIQQTLRNEVQKNAQSEADVDAYLEAANKMLEQKGIAPLKDNPVIRSSLLRAAQKNAASQN